MQQTDTFLIVKKYGVGSNNKGVIICP